MRCTEPLSPEATQVSWAHLWVAIYWTAPIHYLNQWWNFVNWTRRSTFQLNFNQNSNIFFEENAFEYVVCEMAFVLSQPQCVDKMMTCWWRHHGTYSLVFLFGFPQHRHQCWGLALLLIPGRHIMEDNWAMTCRAGNVVCHWNPMGVLYEVSQHNPQRDIQPMHQLTLMFSKLEVNKQNCSHNIDLTPESHVCMTSCRFY